MKCPHENCTEDTERVEAYAADPANNVPAWPGGWTCPHGHSFTTEEMYDLTDIYREVYGAEPFCEFTGPTVPMEDER